MLGDRFQVGFDVGGELCGRDASRFAQVRDQKAGQEDGGYSRLFDEQKLGALCSRVHSATISSGNELERLVIKHANVMTQVQVDALFAQTLSNGVYLITKSLLKSYLSQRLGVVGIEPDFVVVRVVERRCEVIELKDGDNFDTKKASGEVENLRRYRDALHTKLPFGYVVSFKVCMFNQSSKAAIVQGFKGRIVESEAMTGREFCELLGISYDAIQLERAVHKSQNTDYFLSALLAIPSIRSRVETLLSTPAPAGAAPQA